MSFKAGDAVVVNSNYCDAGTVGAVGTVVKDFEPGKYIEVDINRGTNYLFMPREITLTVIGEKDCNGTRVKEGDIIVYFTRNGSCLNHQKAKVEFIGVKSGKSPHIRVLKEDAVQKDLFTRKSWLWSFDNSVKVG